MKTSNQLTCRQRIQPISGLMNEVTATFAFSNFVFVNFVPFLFFSLHFRSFTLVFCILYFSFCEFCTFVFLTFICLYLPTADGWAWELKSPSIVWTGTWSTYCGLVEQIYYKVYFWFPHLVYIVWSPNQCQGDKCSINGGTTKENWLMPKPAGAKS